MDDQGDDDEGVEEEEDGNGKRKEEGENRNRWRRGFSSHGAYQLVEDAVSHTAYSVYTSFLSTPPLKTKVLTHYFTPITIHSLHFS